MSDSENFITRWSRRKQQSAQESAQENAPASEQEDKRASGQSARQDAEHVAPQPEPAAASDVGAVEQRSAAAAQNGTPPSVFDPASLPPLDSITADTDIRAFLAPGVPPELTRAALRRAWSADPKIRDFVGLADYDWDFNTPGAIGGFGALDMTDALRRELTRMVGRSLGGEASAQSAAAPPSPEEQAAVEISREFAPPAAASPAGVALTNPSQDQSEGSEVELYNSRPIPQRDEEFIATQNSSDQSDNIKLIARRSHGRALPK